MVSLLWEIICFLVFWAHDLAKETVYAIFRCRPRKQIVGQNILITGTGNSTWCRFQIIVLHYNNSLLYLVQNFELNVAQYRFEGSIRTWVQVIRHWFVRADSHTNTRNHQVIYLQQQYIYPHEPFIHSSTPRFWLSSIDKDPSLVRFRAR